MELSALIHKIRQQYADQKPFALTAMPDSLVIKSIFQKNKTQYENPDLEASGLVMAPFQFKNNALFIPTEHSDCYETVFEAMSLTFQEVAISETKKEQLAYEALVAKALDFLERTDAYKVVTSRKKEIPIQNLDIEVIIKRLFSAPSNTFRYVWYHPDTGIWCGATPEVLVNINNNSFTTMSLAGTQKIEENIDLVWGIKEQQEQQYVTDAIVNKLQKVSSIVKISKPYTYTAGTVAHLRTDFKTVIKRSRVPLASVANSLHPTPAVCGTPEKLARKFILANEGYDREFYTGFVGVIDTETNNAHLYVNLRCMQLTKNMATLYAGGGVVFGSQPELEWQETHHKLQTMAQVIAPVVQK